jgi:hypothetical protein
MSRCAEKNNCGIRYCYESAKLKHVTPTLQKQSMIGQWIKLWISHSNQTLDQNLNQVSLDILWKSGWTNI